MGIESACIPLPSEIIMPFAGYLVYLGRFNLFWVATAGAIGCNLGSVVAYWIGAKGGRPLVERYGKWVLMSHHDLDRMTWFFEKYGSITVLLARLLPVVRTFIAFPAGIAKMPQLRFHIYTFAGLVAVVFLPGLCRHEAGREVAHRSAVRARHSIAFTLWWRLRWWWGSSGLCGRTSIAEEKRRRPEWCRLRDVSRCTLFRSAGT